MRNDWQEVYSKLNQANIFTAYCLAALNCVAVETDRPKSKLGGMVLLRRFPRNNINYCTRNVQYANTFDLSYSHYNRWLNMLRYILLYIFCYIFCYRLDLE